MRQIIFKNGRETIILGTKGEDTVIRGLRLLLVRASTTEEYKHIADLLKCLGEWEFRMRPHTYEGD